MTTTAATTSRNKSQINNKPNSFIYTIITNKNKKKQNLKIVHIVIVKNITTIYIGRDKQLKKKQQQQAKYANHSNLSKILEKKNET